MYGLAQTLDIPLAELLRDDPGGVVGAVPPASLMAFAERPGFRSEVGRMARAAGTDPSKIRQQVLVAMAAVAILPGRFDELDWHRVLDLIVLLQHPR